MRTIWEIHEVCGVKRKFSVSGIFRIQFSLLNYQVSLFSSSSEVILLQNLTLLCFSLYIYIFVLVFEEVVRILKYVNQSV